MCMKRPAAVVPWSLSYGKPRMRINGERRSWWYANRWYDGRFEKMGKELFFEDVDIADEIPPLTRTPTKEQIAAFARVVRIADRRFTDEAYSRSLGLDTIIAPGNLLLAFLSQMITDWAPGAFIRRLDVSFREIVRSGDTITCRGIITEKHEQEGENLLECDLYIENQRGERPVVGSGTIALPSRRKSRQ
ncbi:MAG: dehydratase [Nitrospinota bacterium]|nr:MAG: dehydratase [Nitrospinota bacterium]